MGKPYIVKIITDETEYIQSIESVKDLRILCSVLEKIKRDAIKSLTPKSANKNKER